MEGGAIVVVDMMGAGLGLGGEVAAVLVTLMSGLGCVGRFFFCSQQSQQLSGISQPKQGIVPLKINPTLSKYLLF